MYASDVNRSAVVPRAFVYYSTLLPVATTGLKNRQIGLTTASQCDYKA